MNNIRLFNEDCISGSKKHIEDNSIDLIISDPPYGIDGNKLDKHYNRNESFVIDGYVEVSASEYKKFSLKWIKEASRILRPGGSVYIISGYTNLHHVLNALHSTDLTEVNHMIWKYNFGVHTTKKYISSHYHILFWQKPKGTPTFNTYCRYGDSELGEDSSSLNYKDREDVFIINREYKPGETKNKNELPYNLLKKLILYSSNCGDTVCDMFLGGFSTAIVAKGLNRIPVGFEISPSAFRSGLSKFNSFEDGYLIGETRVPEKNKKINGGKSWTEEERSNLKELYLSCKGMSKKDAIDSISEKLGRGRWGVEKELIKMGLVIIGNKNGSKTDVISSGLTTRSLNDYYN
ncbi:MAG: site-specific DNA-methyltransferase [Methanomassiliicoccaceae archaeon]|nr:site-specific DNA-methyltransferase [Methanomassiliicoccaceae archaeon]